MKPNIIYREDEYRQANKYLRLARSGRHYREFVTPDVIYKLSLMALDKLTVSFLSFYGVAPQDFGTISLLNNVQEIVYIDDAIIEDLTQIIRRHDQGIRAKKAHNIGMNAALANRVAVYVKEIHGTLHPYLPV